MSILILYFVLLSFCHTRFTSSFRKCVELNYTNDAVEKRKSSSDFLYLHYNTCLRGGVVQWVARLSRNVEVVGSSFIKGHRCFLYCLVLVDSSNGFERDFTIELKSTVGVMEDWLKCQISPLVKYRQLLWKSHLAVRPCRNYQYCNS